MKAALPLAVLAVAVALPAVPADAQRQERRLVIYGDDPCPGAEGVDEIVVCARRPERERYRIPSELRDQKDDDPESTSWAARAESLEYVGRAGIQSCSTVGPGGVSGCWNELVRAWRKERRQGDGEPGR